MGMPAMELKKTKTNRGFRRIDFNDCYGEACSLQKSSLADADSIWFGVNEAKNHHVTQLPLSPRMHLTRANVKKLLPILQHFAETGDLP
jgi:hypothetical protein